MSQHQITFVAALASKIARTLCHIWTYCMVVPAFADATEPITSFSGSCQTINMTLAGLTPAIDFANDTIFESIAALPPLATPTALDQIESGFTLNNNLRPA